MPFTSESTTVCLLSLHLRQTSLLRPHFIEVKYTDKKIRPKGKFRDYVHGDAYLEHDTQLSSIPH